MIEAFFKEVDHKWERREKKPLRLKVIGCAALILQHDYKRGTKDADILEVGDITPEIRQKLKEIAGKESKIFKKYHIYIDLIKSALPFLPPKPVFNPLNNLNKFLRNFRVEALDVTDVVISKLKRFKPPDIEDIRAVVEKGLIDPDKLKIRFDLALDRWLIDARAEDLSQIVENLHTVQRDLLLVEESTIELPDWLE